MHLTSTLNGWPYLGFRASSLLKLLPEVVLTLLKGMLNEGGSSENLYLLVKRSEWWPLLLITILAQSLHGCGLPNRNDALIFGKQDTLQ